jgi:hypothetical protein
MPSIRFTSLGAAAMVLWLLAGPALLSQTTSGGVNGTVRDASNALVPGATVTLLDLDRNFVRQVESDSAGLYNFPNIPPGRYQLAAEKAGFRRWSGNLELRVQQVAVIDATLAVGDVTSTVEVRAVTPVIAAESSSVANVTESARMRELPLNGMDVTQLFQLTPGVQGECSSCPQGSVYSPHVNGLASGAADVIQDGGSILDRMRGGLPRINPALDSIQEFSVDMNSTAQYSRPTTITMLTKSGTNQLHGSLFEKFRNNADGLRARQRQDAGPPAPYKRNEFGASAGGPVRLPKVYNGTDKTFWFFSYQGLRLREYQSVISTVPTEAMWNGDFSGLHDSYGNAYTIYDPFSTTASGLRTPYAGNKIPESVASNSLFDFLKANTPRPTNSFDPYASNNYYVSAASPQTSNQYTAKIDHHFSNSDYISGRVSVSNFAATSYQGNGPVAPNLAYNSRGDVSHLYNGTITYTHTFSPTTINEFLFAGQRSASVRGGAREDVKWDALLGLANPLNETGWPTITGGSNGGGGFYWDSENKMPEYLTKLIPEDNLTLVRGKHVLKMGFRMSDERDNTRQAQQGQGRYKFMGNLTGLWDPASQAAVPFTGLGMADMRIGYGSYYRINYNRPYFYLRQNELGSYAQDSWKVTPRLTLNYGLRWDYWTPYNESSHRLFNMDVSQYQTTRQLITPAGHPADTLGVPASLLQAYQNAGMTFTTADKAGFPSGLLGSDKRDFGPRIGVAFKLNDKTVLRGGYGIYHWTVPMAQILGEQGLSAPLKLDYTISTGDGNAWPTPTGPVTDYDLFHVPVAGERVGDPNMVDINSPQSTQSPFAFTPLDKNWLSGRAQEWNFTIEREISPTTGVRISYIGNHGGNIMQSVQLNAQQSLYLYATQTGQQRPEDTNQLRANPFWQNLNYRTPIGYSNSHSLQVNLERRTYKGLQFQWFYVFSRNLSTSDAAEGYSSQPGALVPDAVLLPHGGDLAQRQRLVYSNVAGIPKHQVNWNLVYDLPFGRGKMLGRNASGILNGFIGNWQIATIGRFHTGGWLTPQNKSTGNPWWPNLQLIRDPRLSGGQQRVINYDGRKLLYFAGYFNPGPESGLTNYQPALLPAGVNDRVPVTLADGSTINVPYDVYTSMPQNFIQGPSNWNADCSLFKSFALRERLRLRFTADAFNVMNHPNNSDPHLTTGLIDLSQQRNDPRIIQFSLRLDF